MSINRKDKRNFLKISSVLFLSLFTLDLNKFKVYERFKKGSIKFFRKGKKIWILNQNDFE